MARTGQIRPRPRAVEYLGGQEGWDATMDALRREGDTEEDLSAYQGVCEALHEGNDLAAERAAKRIQSPSLRRGALFMVQPGR